MGDCYQWAAFDRRGNMCEWIGTRRTKAEVIKLAVMGLMGVRDYERLGNDAARWRYCYGRGWRIHRVRVTRLYKSATPASGGPRDGN